MCGRYYFSIDLGNLSFVENIDGFAFEENFNIAINELDKFVNSYFDEDGFPLSRNPNDLVFLTRYFLLCNESIKDAQKYIPEFLEKIIERNLSCIKLIKTPDEKVPLFNGGSEADLSGFEKYLNDTNHKKKNKRNTGKNLSSTMRVKKLVKGSNIQ